LKALPPLVGEVDHQPTYTRELVRVEWRPKDPIDLFILTPKLASKPPVVLYLYNYTTNTDRYLSTEFCKLLTKDGVAAVGFSTALSGYRFHDRSVNDWFVGSLAEALTTSAHDVQMVINYLATRNDLDANRIGIYADASSTAVAVLAASVDPRIKVLDLQDTWGDWPVWLATSPRVPDAERPTYLKPEFLQSVSRLDPLKILPSLSIPIRSQYLLAKSDVPQEVREHIEAAMPPQAVRVPHEAAVAEFKKSNGQAYFDWIKDQLCKMKPQ